MIVSLEKALALVPLLIAMNAFFVVAEYALVALRPAQIDSLRRRGYRRVVAAVERLKGAPASAIGAIQVCITMTNLLLGWIGEPAMSALLERLFGPVIRLWPGFIVISTALSFVVVTLLTVVLSELLPKALTLQYVTPAAVATAVPVRWIQTAIYPLVWLMNGIANTITRPLGLGRVDEMEGPEEVSLEELRLLAARAGESGVLSARERSLVLNALAMGRRHAREIMVPRTRVLYLDLRWSMQENEEAMEEYLYSRMPLCDGGLDHVVGVVKTKEFLTAYHAAGEVSVLQLIAQKPVFAPENLPLDALLGLFHEHRTQFVFLVSEYGGVEGIVTLKDVVDELVGEIREGAAVVAEGAGPVPMGHDAMEVSGETPLHDLAHRLGTPEWGERMGQAGAVTVGGLVVATLGRVPATGEEVTVDGVRLRVLESDGRAVRKVGVQME